jgi:hypothetical protein
MAIFYTLLGQVGNKGDRSRLSFTLTSLINLFFFLYNYVFLILAL